MLLVFSFKVLCYKSYVVAACLYFVGVGSSAEIQSHLWFLNHKNLVGVWLLIGFQLICFLANLGIGGEIRLTNNSTVIRNAWRIYFGLGLVFTVQCFRLVVALLTR